MQTNTNTIPIQYLFKVVTHNWLLGQVIIHTVAKNKQEVLTLMSKHDIIVEEVVKLKGIE